MSTIEEMYGLTEELDAEEQLHSPYDGRPTVRDLWSYDKLYYRLDCVHGKDSPELVASRIVVPDEYDRDPKALEPQASRDVAIGERAVDAKVDGRRVN